MTATRPLEQRIGRRGRPTSIAIEGWRGINHSFALVNQHQILELLKLDGLRLFHRDLPFAYPHWTRTANGSGLPAEDQKRIDDLADPGNERVDCLYRIASPYRTGTEAHRGRTVTFMVTELGLSENSFVNRSSDMGLLTRDANVITTPSLWSRDRLVDWGFPGDRITVIPHGVSGAVFSPLPPADRLDRRRALGIGDDDTLFLNIGLSSWNKGIDLLLVAFATLRSAGRKVRLILKDQRDLYGRSVETLIGELAPHHSALVQADTLGAISVVSTNLGSADLRVLYGVADCYVSPYRGEGFNLPVLESIACGTPVIATRGGATDDFCDDDVAIRIPGTRTSERHAASGHDLHFIEPHLADLIDAMDHVARSGDIGRPDFASARARVLERFTWASAAGQLARLAVDDLPSAADEDATWNHPHRAATAGSNGLVASTAS